MTRILHFLVILLAINSVLILLALGIYQITEFSDWSFDHNRMSAGRITATGVKAFLLGLIVSVLMINFRKAEAFLLRFSFRGERNRACQEIALK